MMMQTWDQYCKDPLSTAAIGQFACRRLLIGYLLEAGIVRGGKHIFFWWHDYESNVNTIAKDPLLK